MITVSVREFLGDEKIRDGMLEDYRRNGYSILTGLFDDETTARLRDVWHRIAEERRLAGKKPYATLLMPHLSYAEIGKASITPALVQTIEHFLGGRIDLIQSQLMHGVPGNKGFSPHQDNYYNRADPADGIIAAWIALEDVNVANGGVAVYPGSHVSGIVQTRRDWLYLLSRTFYILRSLARLMQPASERGTSDTGVIERFVYAMPPVLDKPVVPALSAGSVLLMHGDLIHSSGANVTTDRFRRSLLTNYIRKGTTFSGGRLSSRTTYDVYGQ